MPKCILHIFLFISFAYPLHAMQRLKTALSGIQSSISIAAQSPAKTIAQRFIHNHASKVALGTMGIAVAAQSKETTNIASTSPSAQCEQGPISKHKTIADLKKEAAINIRIRKCALGCTRFVGAPSSLQRALNKLNTEQIEAINKYHAAITEDLQSETKALLQRDVELLIRDEEERTEILDNLRWLQRDGEIGYVSKLTPTPYKFLPVLGVFAPLLFLPAIIKSVVAGLPELAYLCFSTHDKSVADKLRKKYKGQNKFKDYKGII